MQINENEKPYQVVMVGSLNVNSGYKLVKNTAYPNIVKDYEQAIKKMKLFTSECIVSPSVAKYY